MATKVNRYSLCNFLLHGQFKLILLVVKHCGLQVTLE